MPRASRLLLAGMLACASRADPVWLSPAETIELGCYAMRHPDLLLGFCKGELELHKTPDLKHEIRSCDYQGLLQHWRTVGSKNGLTRACVDDNVKCYAMANRDLVNYICPAGYAFCSWNNPENHFLRHFALHGSKEGRELTCDSQAARCYIQRNPQVVAEVCGGNAAKCDLIKVHQYYVDNPAPDEGHEFGCDGPVEKAHPTPMDDLAKAEAFALRGVLFAFSCTLTEWAHAPQCKARALTAAIKKETDPGQKMKLTAQQSVFRNASPEQKKQEVTAGKAMYAAYCARSPPPEPKVCENVLLKKQLSR